MPNYETIMNIPITKTDGVEDAPQITAMVIKTYKGTEIEAMIGTDSQKRKREKTDSWEN